MPAASVRIETNRRRPEQAASGADLIDERSGFSMSSDVAGAPNFRREPPTPDFVASSLWLRVTVCFWSYLGVFDFGPPKTRIGLGREGWEV